MPESDLGRYALEVLSDGMDGMDGMDGCCMPPGAPVATLG